MGRSKAFNEELVLDKAIEVFWAKGYEATSIQDLVDAMGIQRGSLYGTFGSKQELFLKSLDRYSLVVVKDLLALLTSKTSALESIELFFDKTSVLPQEIELAYALTDRTTCLVIS